MLIGKCGFQLWCIETCEYTCALVFDVAALASVHSDLAPFMSFRRETVVGADDTGDQKS